MSLRHNNFLKVVFTACLSRAKNKQEYYSNS